MKVFIGIVIILIALVLLFRREKYAPQYSDQVYVINEDTVIEDYYNRQKEYIDTLSKRDRAVIDLYAGNDFFRAINSYQQGLLELEKFPQGWYLDVQLYCKNVDYPYSYNFGLLADSSRYLSVGPTLEFQKQLKDFLRFIRYVINHLNTVIINAPPIVEEIRVCRGSKTKYFVPISNENYLHLGFISVSLNENVCNDFAKDQYMLYSTLKPGTRALFVNPLRTDEDEIILPSCTEIKIIKSPNSTMFKEEFVVEYVEPNICPVINLDSFYLEKYETRYKLYNQYKDDIKSFVKAIKATKSYNIHDVEFLLSIPGTLAYLQDDVKKFFYWLNTLNINFTKFITDVVGEMYNLRPEFTSDKYTLPRRAFLQSLLTVDTENGNVSIILPIKNTDDFESVEKSLVDLVANNPYANRAKASGDLLEFYNLYFKVLSNPTIVEKLNKLASRFSLYKLQNISNYYK
jgi:hypothetical protein